MTTAIKDLEGAINNYRVAARNADGAKKHLEQTEAQIKEAQKLNELERQYNPDVEEFRAPDTAQYKREVNYTSELAHLARKDLLGDVNTNLEGIVNATTDKDKLNNFLLSIPAPDKQHISGAYGEIAELHKKAVEYLTLRGDEKRLAEEINKRRKEIKTKAEEEISQIKSKLESQIDGSAKIAEGTAKGHYTREDVDDFRKASIEHLEPLKKARISQRANEDIEQVEGKLHEEIAKGIDIYLKSFDEKGIAQADYTRVAFDTNYSPIARAKDKHQGNMHLAEVFAKTYGPKE